jgi:glycosyltransferase involved in cell wall biosynthesis
MLRAQGFEVIYYGVEGMHSGASEDVTLLSTEEHLRLLGISKYHEAPTAFVGDKAVVGKPLYTQFNFRLRDELTDRLEPGDIVCLPFGHAHANAIDGLELIKSGEAVAVETGIGYPDPYTIRRVFESQAWRHWVTGYERREGSAWNSPRQEWVIPNYYFVGEWPVVLDAQLDAEAKRTIVFLGRINESKGCALIPQLARAFPHLRFVMCGQGDPEPYLTEPNIEYHTPIAGRERAWYLGHAAAAIFPSRMIEPFCGAAVESMLCGTPVLTSDVGAFVETNLEGITGYRCADEGAFINALESVMRLRRADVAESARSRFATDVLGPKYAAVFDQVAARMRPLVTTC